METIIFVQWLTIAMRYCNSLENAFFLLSPSPFIFHPSYLIKSNIIVMGKSTVRLSRDKTSVCIYLVQKRNEEKKNLDHWIVALFFFSFFAQDHFNREQASDAYARKETFFSFSSTLDRKNNGK